MKLASWLRDPRRVVLVGFLGLDHPQVVGEPLPTIYPGALARSLRNKEHQRA